MIKRKHNRAQWLQPQVNKWPDTRNPGFFCIIAEEFRILMSGYFELLDHDSENVRMYRGVGTIFIPPKAHPYSVVSSAGAEYTGAGV